MSLLRATGLLLLRTVLVLPALWGAAALWFDGPASRALAGAAAGACALVSVLLLFRTRPARRGLLLFALGFAALVTWWLSIPPRNDRDWMDDVARSPRSELQGEEVTVQDVRHFTWRSDSDYDVRWETREYDLTQVTGLDLFLCYWGPRNIAHTILSWEFADGRHLAISIETRKERGEEYSAVRGFFRQFELYYVVADERDVIGVRTDCRGEDVYLYRLRTPPERARALLLEYLAEVDELAAQPAWYNALTGNCTTMIFKHIYRLLGYIPGDWRILVNGYIDEMLWDEGIVNTTMSAAALRERSAVSPAARAAGQADDFSARIRVGLPDRPPPPPP